MYACMYVCLFVCMHACMHACMQPFFADRAKYFSSLGEEVTVFFPRKDNWASKEVKERILEINDKMKSSGYALALYNGMAMFLKEKYNSLQDGDEDMFYEM